MAGLRVQTVGGRIAPLMRPNAPGRGYDPEWVRAARAKKQLEALFFGGAIGIDQLWLNSKTAIAMTRDAGRG
jgi:hypothetical protein